MHPPRTLLRFRRVAVAMVAAAHLAASGVVSADPDLVAHWTFDGSDFADASGNGLALVGQGAPVFGPGPFATAVTFPNLGSSAGTTSGAFAPRARSWSVSLWCRVAPDTSRLRAALSWYRCGANPACNGTDAALYQLLVRPDGRPEWYVRGDHAAEGRATAPAAVTDAAWHHLVGTFEPATGVIALYVDGALADTAIAPFDSLTATTVSVPLQLGRIFRQGWGAPGEYLEGSLDDVRVLARAVSPAEVAALFQGSTAGIGAGAPGVRFERAVPEPFRRSTRIAFTLERAGPARLSVHDVAGRELRRLHDGRLEAGAHAFTWDGRDANGARVPAGVYFYRVGAPEAGGPAVTRALRGTLVR